MNAPTLKSVRRMGNLQAALREVNRRPIGIDGVPYCAFISPLDYSRWNPGWWLEYGPEPLKYIQGEIEFGYGYTPYPTQEILVRGRTVERSTVHGRIIERAISRKLSLSLDKEFSSRSWAYRPHRSAEDAILEVRRAVRSGFHYALKTDVKNFFDNVDRQILKSQLRNWIPDRDLCALILAATSPRIGWTGRIRKHGLPQGNGLSSFLSNLYLTQVDKACEHMHYFRFADDVLILGRSLKQVLAAREFFGIRLAQLHLRRNDEKTDIRDLHKKSVVFLGYEIRGGNIYPPQKAVFRLEKKLRVRGHEVRKVELMKGFVRRYRIGPVRKLFRRIDRELQRHYPDGVRLTGMLDNVASFGGSVGSSKRVLATPKGKAATPVTAKKARSGQAPIAAAAGEQDLFSFACSLAPMEVGHE